MLKFHRAFGRSGRSISIGLSSSEIAVLRTEGFWRARSTLLAETVLTGDVTNISELLVLECQAILKKITCKGLPLNIVLADEWTRLFIVTPPPNCVRLEDCQAAAAMRFQALYGVAPEEWQLEADWNACRPFLACAVPHNLLAIVQKIAGDHALILRTVAPQFIYLWNQWCKALQKGNWFGVVQGQTLSLAVMNEFGVCALRVVQIPDDGHDFPWLQQHVMREALRLNLPAPPQLQVCGNRKNYWHSPPAENSFRCVHLDHVSDMTNAQALACSGMPA